MGRRPVGQRAMTAAERQRRRRQELTATPLTKAETLRLQTLIRQREKLLRSAAAQRSAELMADFERQLASEYSWDQDEIWHQAFDTAKRALAEAKAIIATRCEELGIPAQFAPRARHLLECARPRRAFSQRRAELRAVTKTRIAAIEEDTCLKIELHSVELQTQLLKHALTSEAAMAFLDSLPAVDTLMPVLELARISQTG